MTKLPPLLVTRRNALALGAALPVFSQAAWAQEKQFLASIPIEPNEGGPIVFQLALNGIATRTALEIDMPVLAVDRAFAEANGLTGKVELALGDLKLRGAPQLVNLAGMTTAFGEQIQASIGRPILERFPFLIDAPGGQLHVLHPDAAISASDATEIRDVVFDNQRATIEISLEGGSPLRAGVSYFVGGAIALRETDAVKAWLSDGRPTSTAFAGSVGNPSGLAKVFAFKSLSLGKHVLSDVPVMVEPSGGASSTGPDVVLGPLLLNQFEITLLGRARQIWFTPTSTTFSKPIRRSLTGIYAAPVAGGLAIRHIGANSPASATHLKAGDIIAAIDGAPATRAAFIGAVAGQVLELRLGSGERLKVRAAKYY